MKALQEWRGLPVVSSAEGKFKRTCDVCGTIFSASKADGSLSEEDASPMTIETDHKDSGGFFARTYYLRYHEVALKALLTKCPNCGRTKTIAYRIDSEPFWGDWQQYDPGGYY